MLEELIRNNEKMPDLRAGSTPALAGTVSWPLQAYHHLISLIRPAYSAACKDVNLTTQPLALELPKDWDGPKSIELNMPATVVTVGFGGIMGATFLYLLSNI